MRASSTVKRDASVADTWPRSVFVARFQTTLGAIEGIARHSRAAFGQLAPLFHLVTEVQLELGFADITIARNYDHGNASAVIEVILTARPAGPNLCEHFRQLGRCSFPACG